MNQLRRSGLARHAVRAIAAALGALLFFLSAPAGAAPQARILRIDPRAAQQNGDPVLTTVIEVSQSKRVSDATASCAALTGNGQLDCMSQALEQPFALYTPFPFPAANAIFTVTIDNAAYPAKYVSHSTWGESQQQPGVGTAWLVLIDADRRMGGSFNDARQIALQLVASLGPNDIVDLMFFNDRQVVKDSKWLGGAQKTGAAFINGATETYPSSGRNRSLLTIIKQAATDGFGSLGNVGENVKVPLHQALVVLSSGFGGADPSTTGPGALQLQQYLTNGRFPEDNTALPKSPVPVISVYFPLKVIDEFRQNSLEFMQNLANPEIGGFFTVVQEGGGARAQAIIGTVRQRFSKMSVVRWKVACLAPTITQSFELVFNNMSTPLAGDNTFKDVPIGIDPTQWPLAVNNDYSAQIAQTHPVYPGGNFRVYGDFCWGGDKTRAEVYFLPSGQPLPTALTGANIDQAKATEQQLVAMGMKGTAVDAADTYVEFQAPDKDKILWGSGDQALVRMVVFDNRAHRTSGLTAETILSLKGSSPPLNLMLILGAAFGAVVIALLVVVIAKSGGKKRGTPAPVAAAPAYGAPGGYAAQPGYGQPPHGPSPEFMYGAPGQAAGLGVAAPHPQAAPPSPYGGGASSATLQGQAGIFTLLAGQELRAGRDASQCGILLTEARVSGVHATLKLENGQLWVRDENSNNGTLVNGARIAPGVWSPVPQGSIVRFGPVEFSARLG
ncbi:MAG TPA: FHA domain-containing protein [Polyangiaceae bacterium]|nr:FHA domain-containing protein [Polyangiaceae bacterium]